MPGSENQAPFANSSANAAALFEPSSEIPPSRKAPRPSHFRQFVESLLCLALAVIVFRAFQVEGYMISTGSMAPALLGFHKQVVCPSCQFPFAFGVSYQTQSSREISGDGEDDDAGSDISGHGSSSPQLCTCPNCGQRAIDISQVPRNQGDQLLVFREAYWGRLPRRWEVIVFRNPYETTQAYVKRLAGLPGETIEIRDGDVYANGTLCRKEYRTQKAVRIPVFHQDYEPVDDPDWQPRWQAKSGWKRQGPAFQLSTRAVALLTAKRAEIAGNRERDVSAPGSSFVRGLKESPLENAWSWLTYGHYLRSGGWHSTSVTVPVLNKPLNWPSDLLPAQFDPKTRRLTIQGVMPRELKQRLRDVTDHPDYLEAVEELAALSHFSPITDGYGYNRDSQTSGQNAVRDIMISLRLDVSGDQPADSDNRQFAIDLGDGKNVFRLLLDFKRREIQLLNNPELAPDRAPVQKAVFKSAWDDKPVQIEMSMFDRQIVVAINEDEVFPAWPIPSPPPRSEAPRFPVRVGAQGLAARVEDLQLFRDVYYTSKGDEQPFTLKEDELYVLGDNSPVSLDSRRWENGAVPMRLLLGKPFVVHLPSRQMKVRIGETVRHIRIPDFARLRYIR